VAAFSEAQKEVLERVVITGRGQPGSNIYYDIEASGIIDRDMIGFYRPNPLFLPELERWLKNRPTPRD
jgi:hypothetical protein